MIKLVIEEYVASLKEKDELDILLPNLLKLQGYIVMNIPKTGERQYGVDLLAEKDGEIYLYVIKQGNLTRSVWAGNVNAVYQSIEEIFNVYLPMMLDPIYKDKQKHIVIVLNGVIRDSVRLEWEGYKRRNEAELISFDTILLHDLVKMVYEHGFNETLFSDNMHSNLRKCLYYLDEPDYKTTYYKLIVEEYIILLSSATTDKERNKIYHSFQMFVHLVNSNVIEKKRFRIGIEFAEIILVKLWKYIKDTNNFENQLSTKWLNEFIGIYNMINEFFVDSLEPYINVAQGIPSHNNLQHRLLCFDILGKLVTYGLFLTEYEKLLKDKKYTGRTITKKLIELFNNNYGFYYPLYDNDGIEISLFFHLLQKQNQIVHLKQLVKTYTSHILAQIQHGKYPVLERRFSLVLDVEFNDVDYEKRYVSSFLWGVIKEWALLLDEKELVDQLAENEIINHVHLQNWNCAYIEECGLYDARTALNQGYSKIYNDLTINELLDFLSDETVFDDFKQFSFIKYSFPTLGFILSRLYRVPVIPTYWRKEFFK